MSRIYDKCHDALAEYLITPFLQLDEEPSRIKAACKAYLIHPFANLTLSAYHVVKTIESAVTACFFLMTSIFSGLMAVSLLGRVKTLNTLFTENTLQCALSILAIPFSLGLLATNIAAGAIGFFNFRAATHTESAIFAMSRHLIQTIWERPNEYFRMHEGAVAGESVVG